MLTFPYSTLRASSILLDIFGQTVASGLTNTGQQQRVNATGGGLWTLQLEFPQFNTANQLRAWRVIQYGGADGVVPINIAICDIRQAPRPFGEYVNTSVTHSDGSSFSDGSLYSSALISANLTANAAVRATTISVAFGNGSVPLGGEFFSLRYNGGLNEIHVITNVVETATGYNLTIVPPLRAAHVTGETLNFDHPTGTFVLAGPGSMSMATVMGKRGTGTASFVEYIPE